MQIHSFDVSKRNDMSNDEIIGRLAVLEVFAMTGLGLYLAIARDPDYSHATALLESTRRAVANLTVALSPAAQAAAADYSDHLLTMLADNLRKLRGEDGQPH
jgi:hypothetical protein